MSASAPMGNNFNYPYSFTQNTYKLKTIVTANCTVIYTPRKQRNVFKFTGWFTEKAEL
jgi:hypothetical protein